MRSKLPELPEARRDRFVTEYGLPLYDANLLTSSRAMADYFEESFEESRRANMGLTAKDISNWLLGEASRIMNVKNIDIDGLRKMVSPKQLCQLLRLIPMAAATTTVAKVVFEEMSSTGRGADEIIQERGLSQISDTGEIKEVVSQVVDANPKAVADYKAGKAQSLTFLVGQVMRVTKGRANPKLVNEQLKKRLEEG